MRPIVLMDVDGIIADFVTRLLAELQLVTGRIVHPDDVPAWDVLESLGVPLGFCDVIYKRMEEKGVCRSIPVLEGAKEGVAALRELADVYPVTAPFRGEHWMHERAEWLKEHFGFAKSDVTHSSTKHLIYGDFLIEDKTSTLVRWSDRHPLGTPILFERSYNRSDGWTGLSVKSWPELVTLVKSEIEGTP